MSHVVLYPCGAATGRGYSISPLREQYVTPLVSCALTHSFQFLRSLLPSPAVVPSCPPPSVAGRLLSAAPEPRLLQLVPALAAVVGLLASPQVSSPPELLFFWVLLAVDCLFSKRLSVTILSNTRKIPGLFLIVDDGFFFFERRTFVVIEPRKYILRCSFFRPDRPLHPFDVISTKRGPAVRHLQLSATATGLIGSALCATIIVSCLVFIFAVVIVGDLGHHVQGGVSCPPGSSRMR